MQAAEAWWGLRVACEATSPNSGISHDSMRRLDLDALGRYNQVDPAVSVSATRA